MDVGKNISITTMARALTRACLYSWEYITDITILFSRTIIFNFSISLSPKERSQLLVHYSSTMRHPLRSLGSGTTRTHRASAPRALMGSMACTPRHGLLYDQMAVSAEPCNCLEQQRLVTGWPSVARELELDGVRGARGRRKGIRQVGR